MTEKMKTKLEQKARTMKRMQFVYSLTTAEYLALHPLDGSITASKFWITVNGIQQAEIS